MSVRQFVDAPRLDAAAGRERRAALARRTPPLAASSPSSSSPPSFVVVVSKTASRVAMARSDDAPHDDEPVVALDDDSVDDDGGSIDPTGGTDDEIPPGGTDGGECENYFGRAAKEGAAPAGTNPFASSAAIAPEDDWRAQMEVMRPLPVRPRSRCARRSLRTFPVVTLHPRSPFNVRLTGKTFD